MGGPALLGPLERGWRRALGGPGARVGFRTVRRGRPRENRAPAGEGVRVDRGQSGSERGHGGEVLNPARRGSPAGIDREPVGRGRHPWAGPAPRQSSRVVRG